MKITELPGNETKITIQTMAEVFYYVSVQYRSQLSAWRRTQAVEQSQVSAFSPTALSDSSQPFDHIQQTV